MLGINLPHNMNANPAEPRGRAAWLSVTAAIIRAAASYLQINSSELAAGIRPWVDFSGRLQAEVFVYDTLPNGAGYASEVAENIEEILKRARDIAMLCPAGCESACYSCLLDYGNQRQHGLIDRRLAVDLLAYVLDGTVPTLSVARKVQALEKLSGFAPDGAYSLDATNGVARLERRGGAKEIRCVHGLATKGSNKSIVVDTTNLRTAGVSTFSEFDLLRRPFWVWNSLT